MTHTFLAYIISFREKTVRDLKWTKIRPAYYKTRRTTGFCVATYFVPFICQAYTATAIEIFYWYFRWRYKRRTASARKGKEKKKERGRKERRKKAMVALLVFIMAILEIFGRKNNCWPYLNVLINPARCIFWSLQLYFPPGPTLSRHTCWTVPSCKVDIRAASKPNNRFVQCLFVAGNCNE